MLINSGRCMFFLLSRIFACRVTYPPSELFLQEYETQAFSMLRDPEIMKEVRKHTNIGVPHFLIPAIGVHPSIAVSAHMNDANCFMNSELFERRDLKEGNISRISSRTTIQR